MSCERDSAISPVIIGVMISAFVEGDIEKGTAYATLIADKYRDDGNERAARIILKRLDGSYKNSPVITMDSEEI